MLEAAMLKGVCHFYTETGTEGGYWAFQDIRFTTESVPQPYCKKCGKYLDPQVYESLRAVKVLPLTPEALDGGEPPECPEGQHVRDSGDSWSYEGLHILGDGDHLTIYSPEDPTKVVWQGTISLHQHPLFSESASGCWIHADQEGVDREEWAEYFFEEYPAELIPASKP